MRNNVWRRSCLVLNLENRNKMRFQKIGLTTVVLCTVGIQQSFSIDIVTKENLISCLFWLMI